MGKIVVLLTFTFIAINNLYSQWTDSFDDGNFYENPQWIGDTSKFIINNQGMLQLKAGSADVYAQISTLSAVNYKATWSFNVQMDFNPSSGNYVKVYLMSDSSDFNNAVNGYFIRIGHSADDICLYKQTGTVVSLLIDGRDKMLNSSVVNATIMVKRDSTGNWTLMCDTTGFENYTTLGKALDFSFNNSRYFGLCCIFTSTRADKFRFDNFCISGEIFEELKPPAFTQPAMYDIVFNEIMADPSPSIALPDAEYLELYNRSKTDYHTKNWKLKLGSYQYTLPDTIFKAESYLVFTSKNATGHFNKWCSTVGLFTSSTTLTNSGQYLELTDSDGKIISWLEYEDTWYADEFKKDGGWSLEMIDPNNPCTGRKNWAASNHKNGGTPGSKNSIYRTNTDNSPPYLKNIEIIDETCIHLVFNESLSMSALDPNNFLFGNKAIPPSKCIFSGTGFNTIALWIPYHLTDSIKTNITINKNVADCSFNTLSYSIDTLLSLPKTADSLDVVINEVLFNAKAYCPEYIEIYNRSEKILSASDLLLVIQNGASPNTYRLSNRKYLFYPGSYLLMCSDPEKLSEYYNLLNPRSLFCLPSLTSLDDNSGHISIKTLDSKTIDSFKYNEEMHLSILHNTEGISLERINPKVGSDMMNNWHSAAETAGFGTPGYKNSQYISENNTSNSFYIENEIFSPDNDGYNDVLPIHYKLEPSGVRMFAWVFDLNGRKIRELANNNLVETSGILYWDGYTNNKTLCPVGLYLIYIRVSDDKGNNKEYKLPCVLAMRR